MSTPMNNPPRKLSPLRFLILFIGPFILSIPLLVIQLGFPPYLYDSPLTIIFLICYSIVSLIIPCYYVSRLEVKYYEEVHNIPATKLSLFGRTTIYFFFVIGVKLSISLAGCLIILAAAY